MDHPERLGRYAVTGVLGEGAMGVVYQAYDPVIKRPLAIKTIRRALHDGDDAVDSFAARFRNEAAAAGRLQHPGIVAVYEYGEDATGAYIVMEYVDGISLSKRIAARESFTPDRAVDIVGQVLDALHHAHEQGVWHRDIKPANLILTPSGRVKIADFGIARIESAGITQMTATIGTPGHMAPEQYTGEGLDRRVDVFATGVLLYQLLTGRQPFAGSHEAVMYQVLNQEPPPPSQVSSMPLAAVYDTVVGQALAKRVDERFATAGAFRRALLDAHAAAQDATRVLGPAAARPAPVPVGAVTGSAAFRGSGAGGAMPPAPAPAVSPLAMAPTLAIAGSALSTWDPKLLHVVEVALAVHVGPLARMLVQRAARQRRDLAGLQAFLLPEIGSEEGRVAFTQAVARIAAAMPDATQARRSSTGSSGARGAAPMPAPGTQTRFFGGSPAALGQGAGSAAGTSVSPDALTPTVLEHAQKILTRRIGPIARVIVKKAASESDDRERFYARLLDNMDPSERAAVLEELRRGL